MSDTRLKSRWFAVRWFGWSYLDTWPFVYRSNGGWSLYLCGVVTITWLRPKREALGA